jgi:hypothetical protein
MKKLRVTGNFYSRNSERNYKGIWCVPSASERSLLFACRTWHKAVAYAMLHNDGVPHKNAVRLARHCTPDFRV